MVDEAEKRDLILMVGHLLQYHPAFLAVRQLVTDGSLGELRYLYSNRLNLGRFRREENILWSFAPHDLSMILALVGEAPDEVSAVGSTFLQRARRRRHDDAPELPERAASPRVRVLAASRSRSSGSSWSEPTPWRSSTTSHRGSPS